METRIVLRAASVTCNGGPHCHRLSLTEDNMLYLDQVLDTGLSLEASRSADNGVQ